MKQRDPVGWGDEMTAVLDGECRHAETFWAALEATPGALVVMDGDGVILFVNEAAERMFGHARAELHGAAAGRLLAPSCRVSWADRLARLTSPRGAEQAAPRDDLIALHKDGREFPVELSLGLTKLAGAPRTIALFRDITEGKRAEERHASAAADAKEGRGWLEALLEFAPAIILAVNRSGTIEYINRVLPQYTKAQVIGSFWLQYFPPELQGRMKAGLETVLATETEQVFESATLGHDGSTLWYASQLGPIRAGEQIVGAVVVAQDITERKRTETELLAARRMAVLGTLAAGVAHEINTPIQFVGDSIRFLRDSALDLLTLIERFQTIRRAILEGQAPDLALAEAEEAEEQADLPYIRDKMPAAFDRSIDGLNRVAAIVRSLKEFAHPSDEEMAPVDLNHAIESTLTIAANEYRYVADLETDFGDLPPVVCHLGEISQVVLNVIVNAAHAIGSVTRDGERKGVIRVRTRHEGETVLVAISDTGGGIPEDIRSRIFDPFFTTKDVGKGTGQGLAISWSTVKEKHGGELTFETKVGEGTTFFIRLPIAGKSRGDKESG